MSYNLAPVHWEDNRMALEIPVLRNTLNLSWCPADPEPSPDLQRPQGWLSGWAAPERWLRGFITRRGLHDASHSVLSVVGTVSCHAPPGPGPAPAVQL